MIIGYCKRQKWVKTLVLNYLGRWRLLNHFLRGGGGDTVMVKEDEQELVHLLEPWLENLSEKESSAGLPDNLYNLAEIQRRGKSSSETDDTAEGGRNRKGLKQQWGSVLMEKRPSRMPQDGRAMMEKAQDRKRLTNQETLKGNTKSKSSFDALASDEIVTMANVIDISLGKNDNDVLKSSVEVMDRDRNRSIEFRAQCSACQGEVGDENNLNVMGVPLEEEITMTPHNFPNQPQMEGSPNMPGQWTLVVNRKKSKSRLPNERNNTKHLGG
jgi:hypothetical protein